MRRRDFITLLGGVAVAWPLAARAPQPPMRRIGVLLTFAADDSEGQARLAAFVRALADLGWTADRNVRIESRSGATDVDRVRRHAAELVALAPEVVLAGGATALRSLQQATATVPIVIRGGHRSGRRWPSRELGKARRQLHRLYQFRIRYRHEMAGIAQADRARHDANGGRSGPRRSRRGRAVWRNSGRGAVVRGGGNSR